MEISDRLFSDAQVSELKRLIAFQKMSDLFLYLNNMGEIGLFSDDLKLRFEGFGGEFFLKLKKSFFKKILLSFPPYPSLPSN